jgi:hypothetical protein
MSLQLHSQWGFIIAAGIAVFATGCGGETSKASQCGAIDACGGDLTGSWKVTGICASISPGSMLTAGQSTSLPAACGDIVAQAVDRASYGAIDVTVTFTGTQLQEAGAFEIEFPLDYTSACLSALGAPQADESTCNEIAGGVTTDAQDSATCTVASGGCACTVSISEPIDVTGSYQVQGNAIVTDNRMFTSDYCVTGDTATLLEMGPGLNGRLSLERAVGDGGAS